MTYMYKIINKKKIKQKVKAERNIFPLLILSVQHSQDKELLPRCNTVSPRMKSICVGTHCTQIHFIETGNITSQGTMACSMSLQRSSQPDSTE